MRISVYGCGYVGLVSAALFADSGNNVVAADINAERVTQLNRAIMPIYEPGLQEIVARNIEQGRLRFTSDLRETVQHGEVQFIAVGTPTAASGDTDMRAIDAVAATIGEHLQHRAVIVNKSTAPVGTVARIRRIIRDEQQKRGKDIECSVISNPEFLKEGAAIADFMRPDRIIIGSDDEHATAIMRALYAPFNRNRDRIMVMDTTSAELTKYAANAMLAARISFINEIARIADILNADIERVRQGIGADPRIGYDFLYAGCGFGGSCFPKDLRALQHTAKSAQLDTPLLNAITTVNEHQKQRLSDMLGQYYGDELGNKRIAIWGGAFKANTDDIRESPALDLIDYLLKRGTKICLYDPQAIAALKRHYAEHPAAHLLQFAITQNAALEHCDALCIVTDWRAFQSPDFIFLAEQLSDRVIFDGRNLYDPALLTGYGLQYFGIGRGNSLAVLPRTA